MSDVMEFVQNEDGAFSAYDDTYDIVIHCETEDEQKKVIERLSIDRIPASADVMRWTVMNMRRSAKNMRLIDADKLKHVIHCAYSDDLEILEKIDEQSTAFDVNEIVEQLENYLFEKYCIEGDTTIDEIIKGGGIK